MTTTSTSIDPTVAKALAAQHSVRFIKEIDIFDIILKGDAKQVVNYINSKARSSIDLGTS
jgi:hypothetical protein